MAAPSPQFHPRTFASHMASLDVMADVLRSAATRLQSIQTTDQALTPLHNPTHAMRLFFHLAAQLRSSRSRAESEDLLLQLLTGTAERQATNTLRDAMALLRLVRQIQHPHRAQLQPS